jgi:hypothetical protein
MPAPAFVVLALVALALAGYVASGEIRSVRSRRSGSRPGHRPQPRFDPGVERRAELKARALLRSIVNPEEWEMYRDLGFIRIVGQGNGKSAESIPGAFSYLIYPHKPIACTGQSFPTPTTCSRSGC